MTRKTKKYLRLQLLAYHQEDYVDLQLHLPVKWIIAITLTFVIRLIPEWWDYFRAILPLLLK